MFTKTVIGTDHENAAASSALGALVVQHSSSFSCLHFSESQGCMEVGVCDGL